MFPHRNSSPRVCHRRKSVCFDAAGLSPTWGCTSPAMNSLIIPTKDITSTMENDVECSRQEEELRGTKRKISLSNCGVCGSEEAKYRCPACLAHSCSLMCVKKHKEDSGCSGVRNKTAFVTLSHFDEMTLLNDYRLLEDTGRFADGANRDKLVRTPRSTLKAKKLAAHARKMNITLRFLPITFTKSKENSTVFTREQLFLWHVKLLFPQSSTEFSQRRVSDGQTLEQILTPYIHPTESDPVTRQKLKIYVQTPFDDVKVFMKAEGRKANSVRYHALDIRKTLKDNLSYKTLIEYPVLHVVLRDHWKEYPLKGPAEPASTCKSFATKKEGVDQKGEDVFQVSPFKQGACTPGGTNIWTGTPETSSETEPPRVKRAKREAREEEIEEGELIDSSDEEKEEEKGNTEDNTPCVKSCDGAKSPANEMEVIKDKPAVHSVDVNVNDGVNEKDSDSSRDQCINKDISAAPNDDMTIELSEKSAEVSMTKEDAVEESQPVHTHHCHDENESAKAADSCGLE
ncbi:box C/D snoRNA protein 1 [Centropristis striata]|uniref:box C/D snoRNA protein 1 n=1 Tax=Centropristis striata TaxID=184440 RepID=UPI0027E008C4|nr:box C/D snoRNA protein 1 [Centropristis striata]